MLPIHEKKRAYLNRISFGLASALDRELIEVLGEGYDLFYFDVIEIGDRYIKFTAYELGVYRFNFKSKSDIKKKCIDFI